MVNEHKFLGSTITCDMKICFGERILKSKRLLCALLHSGAVHPRWSINLSFNPSLVLYLSPAYPGVWWWASLLFHPQRDKFSGYYSELLCFTHVFSDFGEEYAEGINVLWYIVVPGTGRKHTYPLADTQLIGSRYVHINAYSATF